VTPHTSAKPRTIANALAGWGRFVARGLAWLCIVVGLVGLVVLMLPPNYRAVSVMHLPMPVDQAYDIIADVRRWPEIWAPIARERDLAKIQVDFDPDRVGSFLTFDVPAKGHNRYILIKADEHRSLLFSVFIHDHFVGSLHLEFESVSPQESTIRWTAAGRASMDRQWLHVPITMLARTVFPWLLSTHFEQDVRDSQVLLQNAVAQRSSIDRPSSASDSAGSPPK
jgi:hypothetical protein